MEYSEIIHLLKENADEKYKKFHKKLKGEGKDKFYGVRIPKVREISSIILQNDPLTFINDIRFDSSEEKLLYGMVVSKLKCDFTEKLSLLSKLIVEIDSWAVCDCISFKVSKKQQDFLWAYLQQYFNSDKEFEIRFAIITAMRNFLDDEYIDRVLLTYESINSDYYYVNMGLAWAIQVAFIKYKDKVTDLFEKRSLLKDVVNKAVQKIRESRRVLEIDKEKVLKYKEK